MLKNFLFVGLGGMLGSILRYTAALIIPSAAFPWATLAVNIIGSFVIALIIGTAIKSENFNSTWRLFLATGICGGFTTFSAFSAECFVLLQQHRYNAFLLYMALTLLAGLAATGAGFWITR